MSQGFELISISSNGKEITIPLSAQASKGIEINIQKFKRSYRELTKHCPPKVREALYFYLAVAEEVVSARRIWKAKANVFH